jgi:hypothetical protein
LGSIHSIQTQDIGFDVGDLLRGQVIAVAESWHSQRGVGPGGNRSMLNDGVDPLCENLRVSAK